MAFTISGMAKMKIKICLCFCAMECLLLQAVYLLKTASILSFPSHSKKNVVEQEEFSLCTRLFS
jgi:hypothetical protein